LEFRGPCPLATSSAAQDEVGLWRRRDRLAVGQQGEHSVDLAALEDIGEQFRGLSQRPVADRP
jgi:hypothetical protein